MAKTYEPAPRDQIALPTRLPVADDRTLMPAWPSQHELDELRLLAHGTSDREIAERLMLEEGTIKHHDSSILTRLRAATRMHAATLVHERGPLLKATLRLGLAGLFVVVPRLRYDIEVHGLELDPHAPRTFYAITHKRDLDSMAPVPIVLGHRGWHALTGEVHFAMRADSCTPGFLARVLEHPRWLAHALRPLRLGPLLRGIGIHPIQGWHGRPAEEWLRECLAIAGDQPAGKVVSEPFLRDLAGATHADPTLLAQQPLSRLLRWRYASVHRLFYGPEILRGPARREVERAALATIKGQVADIASWLHRGSSIYTSPEGVLSPDGCLSSITSGFHRVVRAAPADLRIQPIAITYDYMTAGRPRLFIDLAPQIERPAQLGTRELDTRLREGWLRAARFGMTQLAARFLVEAERSGDGFSGEDLAEGVMGLGASLAAQGRHVDRRLLRPAGARRLTASYLRYARRHGLVKRDGEDYWVATNRRSTAAVRYEDVGYRYAPLAYAWNELREMLSVEPAVPLPAYEPAQGLIPWTPARRSGAPAR
jgi:DNA-binding CsgD family transcriptional regulator